jgi:hypothetical protein
MKLPEPIRVFFDAETSAGAAAPVSAFAPDAIVKDEGRTYVGHDDIEAWWNAAKVKYRHRAEPLEILKLLDLAVIRAEVTGQFPGSPAVLTFAFQIRDRRIEALEINA